MRLLIKDCEKWVWCSRRRSWEWYWIHWFIQYLCSTVQEFQTHTPAKKIFCKLQFSVFFLSIHQFENYGIFGLTWFMNFTITDSMFVLFCRLWLIHVANIMCMHIWIEKMFKRLSMPMSPISIMTGNPAAMSLLSG